MCPAAHFPRNPNYPHEFSRKGPEFAVPWPDFVPGANGENYKEFSAQLPNRRDLKKADCSFWSKYIRSLKAPAGREPGARAGQGEGGRGWIRSTYCAHTVHQACLSLWEPVGAGRPSTPLSPVRAHRRGLLSAKASCSVGAGEGSERQNTGGGGRRGLGGLWDS